MKTDKKELKRIVKLYNKLSGDDLKVHSFYCKKDQLFNVEIGDLIFSDTESFKEAYSDFLHFIVLKGIESTFLRNIQSQQS